MLKILKIVAIGAAVTFCKGDVVVIGDIHGDLDALEDALKLAGTIGRGDKVVLMGDLVDKGPVSDKVIEYVAKKQKEVDLTVMMGNHELMSLQGLTEYVHPEELSRLTTAKRISMFLTTGAYGSYILQNFKIAYLYNSSIFVHAGLTQTQAMLGISAINRRGVKAIRNESWNDELLSTDGPLWNRDLLNRAKNGHCRELDEILKELSKKEGLPVTRMFVGHTIQDEQKVRQYCKGQLIAVDVGMSNGTMIGDKRRAVTVIRNGGILDIKYAGKSGIVPKTSWWEWDEPRGPHGKTSLFNQGFVILSFLATILTPCVAAGSVAFLVKVAKKLRYNVRRPYLACVYPSPHPSSI